MPKKRSEQDKPPVTPKLSFDLKSITAKFRDTPGNTYVVLIGAAWNSLSKNEKSAKRILNKLAKELDQAFSAQFWKEWQATNKGVAQKKSGEMTFSNVKICADYLNGKGIKVSPKTVDQEMITKGFTSLEARQLGRHLKRWREGRHT